MKVDWASFEDVKRFAESLGPGHTVLETHWQRGLLYSITHTRHEKESVLRNTLEYGAAKCRPVHRT
jgi:hypothetical protein